MKRREFEICKSIFETLSQKNPVHKSDLREFIGLGARSVNKWVDLIAFIQSQPYLKITKKGRYEMLELEKAKEDTAIYPETLEALKLMQAFLELPTEDLKKKLEALK